MRYSSPVVLVVLDIRLPRNSSHPVSDCGVGQSGEHRDLVQLLLVLVVFLGFRLESSVLLSNLVDRGLSLLLVRRLASAHCLGRVALGALGDEGAARRW